MADPPPDHNPEPRNAAAPTAFGPFKLLRRLAVGGTSEVFLATKEGDDDPQPFVIKRLLPGWLEDPAAAGMFRTEAALHHAVDHPNVVGALGAGEVDGEPYLALEYVPGIDGFRLLRRLQSEGTQLPIPTALYIALKLCSAVQSVHSACDANGEPLGVVHRDITPSNIYLSETGEVFLGDFGIARATSLRSKRPTVSAAIKGKYNYLAPEQVAGDDFDHRADIFSLAVVLSELLLGKPLFEGAGQLAVLLAIRDARITALVETQSSLPPGLFQALAKALSKNPADRFDTASHFASAILGYLPPHDTYPEQVAEWVEWARDTRDLEDKVRSSRHRLRAQQAVVVVEEEAPLSSRDTSEFEVAASYAKTHDGRTLGPLSFARVVELIVTGQLNEGDLVNLMGEGYTPIEEIELLARHLPEAVTSQAISGPEPPSLLMELSPATLLKLLGQLHCAEETGLLMLEGGGEEEDDNQRREIYIREGQLHHIASGESQDLLGQGLVRQGLISREELDMALAVLPLYRGHLGDTLLALGLADAVQLFQAIRTHGRKRMGIPFGWSRGSASFYRGIQPANVEFPLDVNLAQVMLDAVEQATIDEPPPSISSRGLGSGLRRLNPPYRGDPQKRLPKAVTALLDTLGEGMAVHQLLERLLQTHLMDGATALRALEVGRALGLVGGDAPGVWVLPGTERAAPQAKPVEGAGLTQINQLALRTPLTRRAGRRIEGGRSCVFQPPNLFRACAELASGPWWPCRSWALLESGFTSFGPTIRYRTPHAGQR